MPAWAEPVSRASPRESLPFRDPPRDPPRDPFRNPSRDPWRVPTGDPTKDPLEEIRCPICGVVLTGSNAALNRHVDSCLGFPSPGDQSALPPQVEQQAGLKRAGGTQGERPSQLRQRTLNSFVKSEARA